MRERISAECQNNHLFCRVQNSLADEALLRALGTTRSTLKSDCLDKFYSKLSREPGPGIIYAQRFKIGYSCFENRFVTTVELFHYYLPQEHLLLRANVLWGTCTEGLPPSAAPSVTRAGRICLTWGSSDRRALLGDLLTAWWDYLRRQRGLRPSTPCPSMPFPIMCHPCVTVKRLLPPTPMPSSLSPSSLSPLCV